MFVVFATPSLTHQVSLEFFRSYLATSALLSEKGVAHACIQVGGDCYLAKARNRLVHLFLTNFPDATDLFFIDDDVGWDATAVVRLLEAGDDVVAGVYPHKQDKRSFPVDLEAVRGGDIVEVDGLVQASNVPAGFLRIRRSVIEKIAFDSPIYMEPQVDGSMVTVRDVFQMGRIGDRWYGEDVYFCRRLAEAGIKIWVDPTFTFTHTGRKQWQHGTLADAIADWRVKRKQQMEAA